VLIESLIFIFSG